MKLKEIYKKYPSRKICVDLLENILWDNTPVCPYCESTNQSPIKSESRYHCNACKTTYSVTVNTVFHKTRLDLQKWFALLWIYFNSIENLPLRETAKEIGVTKDTVWLMEKRIRESTIPEREILKRIISSL